MTAFEYYEKYLPAGEKIAGDDLDEISDGIKEMQELFKALKAEPRELQLEFFLTWMGSALGENDLQQILDWTFDYYPRIDSSFFVSFNHLLDK